MNVSVPEMGGIDKKTEENYVMDIFMIYATQQICFVCVYMKYDDTVGT